MNVHIQYIMLWEFKDNKGTKETAKKVSGVYGQGVIADG